MLHTTWIQILPNPSYFTNISLSHLLPLFSISQPLTKPGPSWPPATRVCLRTPQRNNSQCYFSFIKPPQSQARPRSESESNDCFASQLTLVKQPRDRLGWSPRGRSRENESLLDQPIRQLHRISDWNREMFYTSSVATGVKLSHTLESEKEAMVNSGKLENIFH